VKIVSRGDELIVSGSRTDIIDFEKYLDLFLSHIEKYGKLTEGNIDSLMGVEGESIIANDEGEGVIVYGNGGIVVKAKSTNQRKMVAAVMKNDMVFAMGPAGTGKTYTAVALAVRALKNREVKKIILTRPAVESGENLGFLPGDLKEKLDPYMQPLYDALRDMIPAAKLAEHLEKKVIEIAPLAFMRGRTLNNAFVILDEAQNTTEGQIKMFLTRMGEAAKFVITGDITQIDLPRRQPSGLVHASHILRDIEGIAFVYLDGQDVMRHRIVKEILTAYERAGKE
jgi:phosphate starvation-inducible PhoH-like protein